MISKLILASVLILFSIINMQSKEPNVQIKLKYFHATLRCHGCIVIEDNINNSLNSIYENELKDSTIVFNSLDFLEDENKHFQDDYKFDSQTLILSKFVNGKEVKWKNLDKIWDYSGDYEKFLKYIKNEVDKFLLK